MPHTIHISRSAPWLPPSLLEIPGEIRHIVRISEPERKIFRRGKKRRPSRWCELFRVVTMSRLSGKWKNEITPYLTGIMDASFFHSVRQIVICAGPQTGKTEAVNNCLAVAIDQAPGPAIYIQPDQKTSKDNNADRIQAMIKSSPKLKTYMTGFADDMSGDRIRLIHMPIYFGWAGSPASMAHKPCRYAVNDEVDKPTSQKRETSAILQTENRLTTYTGQEKHWITSSPTVESGPIWKYFLAAQVRFDFFVKCPLCGVLQKMVFGQIKWPRADEPGPDGKCHSEDPERIEAEKLAWYECPHCLTQWDDSDRDLAVRHGQWRDRQTGTELFTYLLKYLPAKIAFHIPSFLSQFVPMGKTAATFLRGLKDLDEFKNFHNKHLAEPWKLTVVSKSTEQILAARCDLPAQTVPEEAVALTCGIDRQKYGFWFVVRAWSPNLTSWLVHYGFVATEEQMEAVLFESGYPVGDTGRTLKIWRAAPDTGGGEKYEDMSMTEEMYFWLLKNMGRGGVAMWGAKGASRALPGMLNLGPAIMSTPAGKKLPGALRILSVDTAKGKDQFHHRIQMAINPETRDLPGAAFLHKDTGNDYVAQILAEEKQVNDKGYEEWVNVHNRPNHLLDAELLAAACVEMEFPGGGLRLLAEHYKRTSPAAAAPGNPPARRVAKSNWMNR